MCKHSKLGVAAKGQNDAVSVSSVSSLNSLVDRNIIQGSRIRSRSPCKHNANAKIGERRLTRSVSHYFTKLKNKRRKMRVQNTKPGIRSSSRLNKSKDRLIITRASRQAVELCSGITFDFDRNPSKQFLFMLSLGLSPNLNSDASRRSPSVKLERVQVNSSSNRLTHKTKRGHQGRKTIAIQSTKENIEAECVRITRRMTADSFKCDRKLRSNQDFNKIASLKSKQLSAGSRGLSTNNHGRISRLEENVASRIGSTVLRARKGPREKQKLKPNIPNIFLVKKLASRCDKKRNIVCIDLTSGSEDGGECELTPLTGLKHLSKCGRFIHPICC